MKKLFEYAVIYEDKIIVRITQVLAHTKSEVTLHAALAIPAEHVDKLDQVHVVIRPF